MSVPVENKYQKLKAIVEESGKLWVESYLRGKEKRLSNQPKEIIICGMGGSAISGDYLRRYILKYHAIPISVNRNYEITSRYEDGSVIVLISYSGNTEETLSIANSLKGKHQNTIVLTSGGKLEQLALEQEWLMVKIPQDYQPRAAFPLICGSLFGIFDNIVQLENQTDTLFDDIRKSSQNLELKDLNYIASNLVETLPVILAPELISQVGTRFRCQLNENAKLPAMDFIVPEFSHNAIVAFDGTKGSQQTILLLHDRESHPRIQKQMTLLSQILQDNSKRVLDISGSMRSWLSNMLQMTWQLDYVSILLAELQKIDPETVPSIDILKSGLNK